MTFYNRFATPPDWQPTYVQPVEKPRFNGETLNQIAAHTKLLLQEKIGKAAAHPRAVKAVFGTKWKPWHKLSIKSPKPTVAYLRFYHPISRELRRCI